MNAEIKKDILLVLLEASDRLRVKDFAALKEISNKTIHNASIFQDTDSVSIAVIIYALSKLADRSFYQLYQQQVLKLIERCIHKLKSDHVGGYKECIKQLFKLIAAYDHKFKLYLDEVIEKAQVKKGSSIYAHGISIARTAEILGVGQWELMSYIGKTRVSDEFIGRIDVKKRIEFARGLFH